MLLFRPPLMRFGRPGVVPANFATGGDEPSPLDNDLPSLTDRAQAEWLWVLLPSLPASGTTEVNDLGGYALVDPADGAYTQDYRGLVMPLAGAPEVYESTITTLVGDGGGDPDTTAPTMVGDIAVSLLTTTSYTTSIDAATDDVGVTAYQVSQDGGSTWTDKGTTRTHSHTGRTPSATDQVRWRARDAAGNWAAPLAAEVTLLDAPIVVPSPTYGGGKDDAEAWRDFAEFKERLALEADDADDMEILEVVSVLVAVGAIQ